MTLPINNQLTGLDALKPNGLPAAWQTVLASTRLADSLRAIKGAIAQDLRAGEIIYPADPWRALRLTELNDVKVVILGQDPYHGPGQAQGLAFSVSPGTKIPPSLRNIFEEIARDPALSDHRLMPSISPDLYRWAQQGVLLLNTSLTVRAGQPASHAKIGWQMVTDALLAAVAARDKPCVFMLWGNHAQSKQALVTAPEARHLVLMANHPSPLSARRPPVPFIGCGHFGQSNEWLAQQGLTPIDWA